MDTVTGTAGDDTINAPATSPTTGLAATTINSGDTIDGGAGNDTLNITISSTNNNSLTGLVVKNVETVNISGTNNLGTSSPALAAAQDAKALTAAALAARQAEATLAVSTDAAAKVVATLAGSGITGTSPNFVSTGQSEFAVSQASSATAATAAARAAAATHFNTLISTAKGDYATALQLKAAADAVAALSSANLATLRSTPATTVANNAGYTVAQYNAAAQAAATTTDAANNATTAATAAGTAGQALMTLVTTLATSTTADANYSMPTAATGQSVPFAIADVRYVAAQVKTAANGTDLTVNDATAAGRITAANNVLGRQTVVASALADVNVLALSTGNSDIVADQEAAAATYVASLASADIRSLAGLTGTDLTNAFKALNRTDFTSTQLSNAANAAKFQYNGAAVATNGEAARASELAALKALVAAVNYDFSIDQLNTAAVNATRDATGASLLTANDDSVAIKARADVRSTATGTAATTAVTAADTALAADTAAANSVTVALAGVTATSISAGLFADATQIWLSGSSNKTSVTGVAATQTIGFDSISSLDSSVTFGSTVSAGSVATKGASGALAVTGATMTSLSVTGTGTGSAGLTITDKGDAVTSLGVDTVKTLNVNTSGSTVLDVTAMTVLNTVNQAGAGGITLTGGTALATINLPGAGADLIKVVTATAIDNPGTTIDETVNASVTTGSGADRLVIATTGTGKTTVDAGDGNDTIYLNTLGSGANSISAGSGNDTIRAEAFATTGLVTNLQGVKIDGGAGTDTLRVANTSFTGSDYTILGANVTSVETLQLSATVSALDASKIAMSRIEFLATGNNTVSEVGSAQTVALVRTAKADAVTGFIGAVANVIEPNQVTIASKGYIADQDPNTAGKQGTVFGDNLNLVLTNTSATTAVAANADKLTMSVTALGNSGTTAAPVAGVASAATVNGDLRSLDVTLTSARGSGTNGLGSEAVAGLTVGTVTTSNLESLSSIKVSGSGSVSINAGTLSALTAKLTSIDLSGMTAFANQNSLGQEVSSGPTLDNGTVGGFYNLSTSSVTLNNNVSETVTLGGARDTINTGSTVVARDTIIGFQVTASSANPLVVDTARSDVLSIGTAFSGQVGVVAGGNASKMVPTSSTLDGALLEAANFKVAGTDVENIVFQFGGNTYVYVDVGSNGLSDTDKLVILSGNVNLDLLVQTGVVI